MKLFLGMCAFFLFALNTCNSKNEFTIAFYNVENLFDTLDNPHKVDNEFMPDSKKEWNTAKYQDKLQKLAYVIYLLGENGPDIMGLCEVENKKVLEDLVNTLNIKDRNYGIAHFESPDRRGIDNALLYDKNRFQPYEEKAVTVNFENKRIKTRDILLVSGTATSGDTLHFIVCHFPSRVGGQIESNPKRMFVAQQTRKVLDSLLLLNPQAQMIVMGDFNDEPSDSSILLGLNSNGNMDSCANHQLYNPMYALQQNGLGTYCYRGDWNMLDQFLMSKSFTQKGSSFQYIPTSTQIYDADTLRQAAGRYKDYPNRTYAGKTYLGGFSDHFPIMMKVRYNKKSENPT